MVKKIFRILGIILGVFFLFQGILKVNIAPVNEIVKLVIEFIAADIIGAIPFIAAIFFIGPFVFVIFNYWHLARERKWNLRVLEFMVARISSFQRQLGIFGISMILTLSLAISGHGDINFFIGFYILLNALGFDYSKQTKKILKQIEKALAAEQIKKARD